MNKQEYEIVKNFSYEEYCDYLSKKYGSADKTGLFKHHTFENVKANLSNPDIAKDATEEERNTITYCSFDEHLFLHILIGEQTDARKALGLGGAVTYIIPQLNKYFDCGEMVYSSNYYSNLDKDVFNMLVKRCDEAIAKTSIALDHNKSIYLQAEKYLEENGKALVVIGTGLGKTTTALEYLWEHKCHALIIGPNNIIKSGWEEYTDWCDTTTYQAFANNYSTIDYSQYGLVILDEAHHAGYDEDTGKGAAVWSRGIIYIIERGVKVLGLTATPERSDKIDIGSTIFKDCVCEGFAVEDGIEKGIIHPFSYVTAYYDTNGIAEEYSNCENKELVGQLDLAINNTPTVKDIFRKHMPNNKRKGIIFIQEIADEQNVIDIMKDVYPSVEMRIIHSKMTDEEVKVNRKWFEETDEGYLLAVNMILEGAHYRGVNTLIMFRRTNSYLVFTQQIGRIITLVKNENPNAIVFDLVNNIENIEYSNRKQDKKHIHNITNIIRQLEKTTALKSGQIIIADETRDIVKCIRKIKEFEDNSWSEEDINYLKKYYSSFGAAYCVAKLNRTDRAIRAMVHKLHLISDTYWTEEEINILKEHYYELGGDVFKLLENKTKRACQVKARRLGLDYKNSTKKWTEEEISILKKYFPQEGSLVYKRFIGRTREQCNAIANFYNISTQIKYTNSEKATKKVICLNNLKIYNSAKEAATDIGSTMKAIQAACIGDTKSSGGLYWQYYEDYIIQPKDITVDCKKNTGISNRKKVKCVETNVVYNSIQEAEKITGIKHISCVCRHERKIAGGYHWEYI